jgi:gamma-D-glutamyl-L-lysine dipeptidyl-peptidase
LDVRSNYPLLLGDCMRDSIQKLLAEFTSLNDPRVSVFDIQFKGLDNGTLSLSGKLLDQDQLAALEETFSNRFPSLSLETASVQILSREPRERVHVATNLTGLYEKPTFGMALSSELYFGTELEVLDEQGKWVFTRQRDGYLGWAYRPYLGEGLAPEATHLVLVPSIEARTEPSETSEVVTRLVSGTGLTAEERLDGWSRVSANKTGWIPSSALRAVTELPKTIEQQRASLIEDSTRMIGVPYLWGGASGNGIDCSGFARLLHHWLGIEIPRDADMQCSAAKPVEPPFEVGDLFFFSDGEGKRQITHVGVSLGGWKMVHSSRGNNGVYIDDVQERQSLKKNFVSAGSFLR